MEVKGGPGAGWLCEGGLDAGVTPGRDAGGGAGGV